MSDVSKDAKELDAGFRYVLDVYSNISRMLLACDAMLHSYGFTPYDWPPMEPPGKASEPVTWLPNRAVRQYFPPDREGTEILTVGAYLYDREVAEPIEPLCIASMMAVSSTNFNAVWWLGMVSAWFDARGSVETIDATDPRYASHPRFARVRRDATRIVRDGRILSIAVPLLEITSTTHVEDRLVRPLLGQLVPLPGGGYGMPSPTSRK